MRHLFAAALTALLSLTATAQNEWVTNGEFTTTMSPWVLGGAYSVNPGHEVGWDTTGRGASDCFGVNAGGQVTPSPYPPNTIEQQVLMIQGLTYEFRADASGSRQSNPTVNNADIGTIWVEVDNVVIARLAFGGYTNNGLPGGEVKRAQICGRFTPATTGQVTLKIFFQRQYLGGAANPRMNLDNVSIRDVAGPTYWIQGNRKIGTTVTHQVRGTPNALFGTFVAAGENPTGTSFPGIGGLWFLDLATTTTLALGVMDGSGAGSFSRAIPADPVFLSTPLFYQAAEWTTAIQFGHYFGVVCTQ